MAKLSRPRPADRLIVATDWRVGTPRPATGHQVDFDFITAKLAERSPVVAEVTPRLPVSSRQAAAKRRSNSHSRRFIYIRFRISQRATLS